MSEELFKIEAGDGDVLKLTVSGSHFVLVAYNEDRAIGSLLTLPELKALHERLGEVLWDVSAGRLRLGEDK